MKTLTSLTIEVSTARVCLAESVTTTLSSSSFDSTITFEHYLQMYM